MPKQNPFSLYDFLGYFVPGAIVVYGVLIIWGHMRTDGDTLYYIKEYISLKDAVMYIPFIIAAYIVGHFLSFLSSVTVEKYSVWMLGYPSKNLLDFKREGFFTIQKKKRLRVAIRIFVACLLAPVTVSDLLLGSWLGMRDLYSKSLDNLLVHILREKIISLVEKHTGKSNKKLSDLGKAEEHDFFRLVYHYALENAPNHFSKMQNYVALYGFLRTMTLITVIFFWVVLWHIFTQFSMVKVVLIVAAIFASYIFFMAFVKFYRRFSLEAMMAMAVTYDNIDKSP